MSSGSMLNLVNGVIEVMLTCSCQVQYPLQLKIETIRCNLGWGGGGDDHEVPGRYRTCYCNMGWGGGGDVQRSCQVSVIYSCESTRHIMMLFSGQEKKDQTDISTVGVVYELQ